MKLRVAHCEILLAGFLLSVASNVYADERPVVLDWLETAAFAGHQTDYSGLFVYQYDHTVETSGIVHVTEANSEYEKLESLDGPKREIIRHDGRVWSYNNHKMTRMDSRQDRSQFPSLLPEQLTALSTNYQSRFGGVERVAGYNAQIVLFEPKDNLRYTHKLWVHTDSGLLLKAAVLDDKNQVAEQYAFTQLQIGGKIDRSWVKECDAESSNGNKSSAHPKTSATGVSNLKNTSSGTNPETIADTPINSGWVADAIPAGFKKTMEIIRPMHGNHSPVTQIVYSDGLSAFSIFIEPNDEDDDDVEGLSSRGAVNLYHKVLDENLITVVGEVPPRTVMQVIDSVRYNGK